ncbi:MAG TPA: DUF6541 family protein [Candidatus Dormibacteraeota bacterium]|jgi:hypothetical protein|nr:DUF6541 family protein [Candidatus Dormibacteraeota bacterium]
MPLSDLARALPGLLLFGLLPGLALATLLAPRWSWWLRLAAAPGLSAGVVGVAGLLAHDAHVPFRAWWVALLAVALVVAAAWRARRGPSGRTRLGLRVTLRESAPQLLALACGVVLVATIAVAFRDEPVPVDSDPAVHAAVAERIASQADLLPVIPSVHDPFVRPRAAAEAVAALSASVGAPSPAAAVLPAALLAVLLTPLGICLLVLHLTGSRPAAMLAPALAAGLPYPALPVFFGEFPLLVDATLIVPGVLAAIAVLRDQDRRQNLAMLVAAAAAIWVVHGLEAITAAAVAVPVALFLRSPMVPWRAWLERATTAVLAVAAGALLVTVLTRVPAVAAPVAPSGSGPAVLEATTLGGGVSAADFLRSFFDFVFPSRLWLVFYVVGVVVVWRLRPLRGLLAAHLLLLLALADVTVTGVLRKGWQKVFPWSEPDRLAAAQYWVLPAMMAAGLALLGIVAVPVLAARMPGLARRVTRGTALAGVVVVVLAVAIGRDHDASSYATAVRTVGMVSQQDLVVMRSMAAQLPAGTPVMTDGIDDAGQWVPALTPDVLLFSKDWVVNHPQDTRVAAIAAACVDPQAARQALEGAGALFVGNRERAGAKHHWTADCVARIPGVRLLARAGDGAQASAAFAVGG